MKHLILVFATMIWLGACNQKTQQAAESHTEPAEEALAEAAAEAGESGYPADSLGEDGRSFHGFRINESDAVPVAQLTSMVGESGELTPVKIEGEISEACQMKGCWMTMPVADGQDMRVRFKDYGFFVPLDCAGKTAVVEGRAFYDTTSVEMLRHYAVDGGMTEAEAEAKYTEPEIALNFEATGVIVK